MTILILADASLPDGRRADLRIAEGRIAEIAAAGSLAASAGGERIGLDGALLAPGFVDGHIHLDKTLLGLPFQPHRRGDTVAERIAREKELRRELRYPVEERARRLIEQVVAFGTTALRSHVDIDSDVRLSGLHALLKVREAARDLVGIQIVAFPQSGIVADPGVKDLLDQAIREGADLVGGLDPAGIDNDVNGHLDTIFAVAERHGVGLDIHLHDPGPLGCFELRQIAMRAAALGLQGRVAVSHAFALGAVDEAEFGRTAEALAAADVAIMTNGPGPVPMPPVKRLVKAGVRVFAGSDNIRDAWSPYGNGDMLERAMMIGYRQDFRADADLELAFDLATGAAARELGLADYGLRVGAAADLVAVPAASVPEAVAAHPPRTLVMKRGRVLSIAPRSEERAAGSAG
ncbi:MAG TPA: amidohydrolase family protein [Roseiarcus sp.]|nr:amidohydrolase family protein [Roseiarcus sp.]